MIGKNGGIGICATERNNFNWLFFQSILNLKERMPEIQVMHSHCGNLPKARNLIIQLARDRHLDYVVMIDSDIVFPNTGILQLIETMEKFDAKIGAGLYFQQTPEGILPTAGTIVDGKYALLKEWNEPRLVDCAGMGFTLITKELFDIEFAFEDWAGEDYVFCARAKALGHKIVFDPKVSCGHLRTMSLDEDYVKLLK
jgi:glycosyltransferase involved in cell wall biosynthesis